MLMTPASILLIIIIHLVLRQALSGTINKKMILVLFSILLLLFMFSIIFSNDQAFQSANYVLKILFILFSPLFTIRGVQKRRSIYLTVLVFGIITAVSTTLCWIICVAVTEVIPDVIIDLFTNMVLLVLCIPAETRNRFIQVLRNVTLLKTNMKTILLVSTWLCAFLASLLSGFFRVYADLPGLALTGSITAVMVILVGIMCPLLIVNNLSSVYYKNLSGAMDRQVRAQVSHYEAMSKVNEDIRKFRHDYKNLRVALVDMLKRDDITSAMTLLGADEILSRELTDTFETGSIVLDALLNEKQSAAGAVNASIEFEGVIPGNLLKPADICVIFGNALDNAIESCAKCRFENKKIIAVKSAFTNGFLFIKIENPAAADVSIINNTAATTKENPKIHGIGLQSMRTSVEKYAGDMTLTCENGIFYVDICLDFNGDAALHV